MIPLRPTPDMSPRRKPGSMGGNGDLRALIGWLAFTAACLFALAVLP
ncbi:hypothetical protein [Parvibaculum sp.]|nr:hypothetical protein [Parvibaculum sp.]MBX3488906.1 hypothetical protein [Parvibaculum sp.]